MSWLEYWNGTPTLYVSRRHRERHDEEVASAIAALAGASDRVLDVGCGEATMAHLVADRCRHLHLWDAAPAVRQRLADRFRDVPRITVLDEAGLDGMIPASVDMVVVNSVAQYLSAPQLRELLASIRRVLAPDGRLIVADIIPPDVSAVRDAVDLLSFAWRGGFLASAVVGLARTAFSEYSVARSRLGLARYSEGEFADILRRHGFSPRRLAANLGHSTSRLTFEARIVDRAVAYREVHYHGSMHAGVAAE